MALRIRTGQKIREPLERFVLLWGGSIWHRRATAKYSEFFEWQLHSLLALEALEEMEPYLVVKRPHVQVARDFMSGVGRRGGINNQSLSVDESERRAALQEAMSILNN